VKPPALVVAAALVSDRNCVAVLGCEWRPLRRWAEQHKIPIHRIGRRPAIRLDAVLAALDGAALEPAEEYDEEKVVQMAARRGARR
jgi:hypothetical protein